MLLGIKSISRKSKVIVSCCCNAVPRLRLFLRCLFQIQDQKREVFLRYSVCISAAGEGGLHRALGDLGLASRSPSDGQGEVLSVLQELCAVWTWGPAACRTCVNCAHPSGVDIPRTREVCWEGHVLCGLQTANKYYVSFINRLRVDWCLHAPVSKVLQRLSTGFLPLCCDRYYRTENLPPMLTYFDEISKTTVFYKNWSSFTNCT